MIFTLKVQNTLCSKTQGYLKLNISKGTFFWARNHEEAEYVNWHEGDPSAGSGEDCVFKSLEPGVYLGWYDYGCDKDTVWSKEIHALCEY